MNMILKKHLFSALSLTFAALASAETVTPPSSQILWYKAPATNWEAEALPIGNGRMGGMVFGGTTQERIALNEISLWSGGENPQFGYEWGPDSPRSEFGSFQPFGDLLIDFKGDGEVSEYIRALDIKKALATVSYKKGDVRYKREVYTSYPRQIMVMTCTADKPGALSAVFSMKSQHAAVITAEGAELKLNNTLKNGMEYASIVRIVPEGGQLKAEGDKLSLTGANSYTLYIAVATDYAMDFKKNWKGNDPKVTVRKQIDEALSVTAEAIKKEHVANYASLFDRSSIELGSTEPDIAKLPTDERLKAYKEKKSDPDLEETLFQYGRYLIISSSRPGYVSLPANLQGLWNDNVKAAWACDYHSDINIEMNYWGTEVTNLPECHRVLIDYFTEMEEPTKQFSQQVFKTADGKPTRGWTICFSQNPFGGHGWSWNIPGSCWYALHMWEHYAFTLNKEYLKKQAYPMMKEVCMFWEDHLKELGADGAGFLTDGKTPSPEEMAQLKGIKAGTLVAPNSWSPEHGPREDGVTHDQQLIWETFTNTIKAAKILGVDQEWTKSLEEKRDRLAPNKIGKEGNLQEWMIDRLPKTEHRHTSHLIAVYPGNQISMAQTPELAEAARKSLEWRGTSGDSVREWAWCWRTALWARFQEGDKAHEMIEGLLTQSVLPNLLGNHPPMQMDGSFGITGSMAEMLLQSHAGEISLLPAPTKAWPKGNVKGLKARGNITVDLTWDDGKVTDYTLTSPHPQPVKVRVNGEVKTITPKLQKSTK